MTMMHWRPAITDDMFVQPLTGTERQGEASFAHDANRRCRLRNDGRVISNDGTGEPGRDAYALGSFCNRTEHTPGKRRVAVGFEPRQVMIGQPDEIEAGLLCQPGIAD